jgi:hypothetical protein
MLRFDAANVTTANKRELTRMKILAFTLVASRLKMFAESTDLTLKTLAHLKNRKPADGGRLLRRGMLQAAGQFLDAIRDKIVQFVQVHNAIFFIALGQALFQTFEHGFGKSAVLPFGSLF